MWNPNEQDSDRYPELCWHNNVGMALEEWKAKLSLGLPGYGIVCITVNEHWQFRNCNSTTKSRGCVERAWYLNEGGAENWLCINQSPFNQRSELIKPPAQRSLIKHQSQKKLPPAACGPSARKLIKLISIAQAALSIGRSGPSARKLIKALAIAASLLGLIEIIPPFGGCLCADCKPLKE